MGPKFDEKKKEQISESIQAAVASLGCAMAIVSLVFAGYFAVKSAQDNRKKAIEDDAKIQRPVLEGILVKEAQIPSDIPERARNEYPYWILVDTNEGQVKLDFDTHDPFYECIDSHKSCGRKHDYSPLSGENYRNKAVDLDLLLNVGDKVYFKTREQIGLIRTAYQIVKVDKK